jgi:ribosome-associated protein
VSGTTLKDDRHTMSSNPQTAANAQATTESVTSQSPTASTASSVIANKVMEWLDEAKAEEIILIDLAGKSSIGDYMIIASGRSDRHVGAIGDQVQRKLKESGVGRVRMEGIETCDWVLIDTGDIIVHIFRPEVRDFYKLEKMWVGDRPTEETTH